MGSVAPVIPGSGCRDSAPYQRGMRPIRTQRCIEEGGRPGVREGGARQRSESVARTIIPHHSPASAPADDGKYAPRHLTVHPRGLLAPQRRGLTAPQEASLPPQRNMTYAFATGSAQTSAKPSLSRALSACGHVHTLGRAQSIASALAGSAGASGCRVFDQPQSRPGERGNADCERSL